MLNLRAGEWVEVKPAEQILGTLDENRCLDGLPFMAEMLQHCGKRFRVHKSAHKTCDTINNYVIRRMANAVHLEALRCGGEAHGGCQAGCLLFFKEAWLKRVDSGAIADEAASLPAPRIVDALVRAGRIPADAGETRDRFRCQATELLKATTEVRRRDRWDPRFYLRDLTSGNVTLRNFVWYGLLAVVNSFTLRWQNRRYPHVCGLAGDKTPTGTLNLQEGEFVQVRSKEEIMGTLNAKLRNRGLFFDVEMVPYCEKESFKVLQRVEKIVDEKTGYMMTLPNPCLILEGVTCSGNLSAGRMFCPRGVYPYWREIWLKRTNPPLEDLGESAAG
jgi:hypothetical protein